jgi:hypothetical protein
MRILAVFAFGCERGAHSPQGRTTCCPPRRPPPPLNGASFSREGAGASYPYFYNRWLRINSCLTPEPGVSATTIAWRAAACSSAPPMVRPVRPTFATDVQFSRDAALQDCRPPHPIPAATAAPHFLGPLLKSNFKTPNPLPPTPFLLQLRPLHQSRLQRLERGVCEVLRRFLVDVAKLLRHRGQRHAHLLQRPQAHACNVFLQ